MRKNLLPLFFLILFTTPTYNFFRIKRTQHKHQKKTVAAERQTQTAECQVHIDTQQYRNELRKQMRGK